MQNILKVTLLVVLFALTSVANVAWTAAPAFDAVIRPIVVFPADPELSYGETTTVTVAMSKNASSPTTVWFESSDPGLLSVPTSAVIPTGSNSVQITVSALAPEGLSAGQSMVGIKATVNLASMYGYIDVQ